MSSRINNRQYFDQRVQRSKSPIHHRRKKTGVEEGGQENQDMMMIMTTERET